MPIDSHERARISPRREDQGAVLRDGEVRGARVLRAEHAVDDRHGPALDCERSRVERDRVQLALPDPHRVIDQMTRGQILRLATRSKLVPFTSPDRERRHGGLEERLVAHGDQQAAAVGQELRPRQVFSIRHRIATAQDLRRSPGRLYAHQARRPGIEHNRSIGAPRAAAPQGCGIADNQRRSSPDGNAFELAVGEEGHPLSIRCEEWVLCTLGTRHGFRAERIQITDIEPSAAGRGRHVSDTLTVR